MASESAHPVEEDAKKAAKKDSRPLYRRLSALGNAGEGSVSGVLNKWVREGRETRSDDLERYVKELRKYKRHSQALEVWYTFPHLDIPNSQHARSRSLLG